MTNPNETGQYDRRTFLAVAGGTLAALAARRTSAKQSGKTPGLVVTQPPGAETGMEILAAGGNAVDAMVATALVAGVVNVSKCGIGGYGGHMMIGLPNGKVTAIDFNSTAPAAARADMFDADERGNVKGEANKRGWLSAGVPGTLAGLQLALDQYGTRPFAKLVRPAIQKARNGFPLPEAFPPGDPAAERLFSRDGKRLRGGDTFRNPELADMLEQLADGGSTEAFYRGEIGQRIAKAFQENGGIVTAEDMASYEAREVTPLVMEWRGHTIATAPLTAGGLTILQTVAALKTLDWPSYEDTPRRTHTWLEALRVAWGDRLDLLGDPEHVDVPVERLLSEEHAQQSADKVKAAVSANRPVPIATDGHSAGGTLHISAVDASGMMVAATLTHGESFGAKVVVDGLGLILGHGISRFDPRPGRPNSIAPGKRPLHNMCPTIVLRDDRPVLALGATGGRRIPNAIFQTLLGYIAVGRSIEAAVSTPRLHTEGGLDIRPEPSAAESDVEYLTSIGYKVQEPLHSFVYAVERGATDGQKSTLIGVADRPATREMRTGFRNPQPVVTRAE